MHEFRYTEELFPTKSNERSKNSKKSWEISAYNSGQPGRRYKILKIIFHNANRESSDKKDNINRITANLSYVERELNDKIDDTLKLLSIYESERDIIYLFQYKRFFPQQTLGFRTVLIFQWILFSENL